jgi:hypothetical protein
VLVQQYSTQQRMYATLMMERFNVDDNCDVWKKKNLQFIFTWFLTFTLSCKFYHSIYIFIFTSKLHNKIVFLLEIVIFFLAASTCKFIIDGGKICKRLFLRHFKKTRVYCNDKQVTVLTVENGFLNDILYIINQYTIYSHTCYCCQRYRWRYHQKPT